MEISCVMEKIFFSFLTFFLISCADIEFLSQNHIQEYFWQTSNKGGKLDVLVVVDNSPSMKEEQRKLGDRIDSFTDQLHGFDWQIAITTTDTSSGPYGLKGKFLSIEGMQSYVLTHKDQNVKTKFKNTVVREETQSCSILCPSTKEHPLKAVELSIRKAEEENKGFFRKKRRSGCFDHYR